jgi:hypothetical protein
MQKMLKPMLRGPYVVINQLIKSIWKVAHLQNTLLYMLGEKKISIQQKMIKIGTFENGPSLVIQKFIVICWLKFLL